MAKRRCIKWGRAKGRKVCRRWTKTAGKRRAKKNTCKYGMLKHPRGRRICRKKRR